MKNANTLLVISNIILALILVGIGCTQVTAPTSTSTQIKNSVTISNHMPGQIPNPISVPVQSSSDLAVPPISPTPSTSPGSSPNTTIQNRPPFILDMNMEALTFVTGKKDMMNAKVTCDAIDSDGDPLTFVWEANEGNISGTGKEVIWILPAKPGSYLIKVSVNDGRGGSSKGNILNTVQSVEITDNTLNTKGNFTKNIQGH
jgi:hypothetical protein